MNPFTNIIHALDHHAYFIHSFTNAVDHLKETLKEKFHIHHKTNPDFFHEKYETFGIDESRRIKEMHQGKSFAENGKKIFIIETDVMTHEAQNALLKIFEEPNADTHFFIVMPTVQSLLPTLQSRLYIIDHVKGDFESNYLKEAENFLKLSKKEKVDYVDELAKKISDEKAQKSDAVEFLSALEIVLYKKDKEKNIEGLKAILKARNYINDRSSSVKQLLEFVALSM